MKDEEIIVLAAQKAGYHALNENGDTLAREAIRLAREDQDGVTREDCVQDALAEAMICGCAERIVERIRERGRT